MNVIDNLYCYLICTKLLACCCYCRNDIVNSDIKCTVCCIACKLIISICFACVNCFTCNSNRVNILKSYTLVVCIVECNLVSLVCCEIFVSGNSCDKFHLESLVDSVVSRLAPAVVIACCSLIVIIVNLLVNSRSSRLYCNFRTFACIILCKNVRCSCVIIAACSACFDNYIVTVAVKCERSMSCNGSSKQCCVCCNEISKSLCIGRLI